MSIRRISIGATLVAIALRVAPAWSFRGEVVEYGEVTAERERPARLTREDHSLVPRTWIEGIRFIRSASNLEGKLCLRFGVSVRLIPDTGEFLPRELTAVVTHPRLTRPDQVSSTEDSFPTPVIGDRAYTGYTFDNPWELQPGEWTIAFRFGEAIVASQTFTIAVPTPIGSVCPPNSVS